MQPLTVEQLIERIEGSDVAARAAARDAAGSVGAPAIGPLAQLAVKGDELEVARTAVRALQNIVYHAGRPGASGEAEAVAEELLKLVTDEPPLQFRRDALWLLWQVADARAVPAVAALLAHDELGEDARMCLEGLPVDEAVAALQARLESAPEDARPALAHSLRKRGVAVPDVPDLRLVPVGDGAIQAQARVGGRRGERRGGRVQRDSE